MYLYEKIVNAANCYCKFHNVSFCEAYAILTERFKVNFRRSQSGKHLRYGIHYRD